MSLCKIKAQQRYRQVELMGSYFKEKKQSRKRLEKTNCRSEHFYIINKNISLRLGD